jgi:hypothetical protein
MYTHNFYTVKCFPVLPVFALINSVLQGFEKFIVAEMVMKFQRTLWNLSFITLFTRAHHHIVPLAPHFL